MENKITEEINKIDKEIERVKNSIRVLQRRLSELEDEKKKFIGILELLNKYDEVVEIFSIARKEIKDKSILDKINSVLEGVDEK